jgi:class 3 adenylate cyclase
VKLLPKVWFKDKIILFGAELTEDDRHLVPFSRTQGKIPGLYIHAYALAQIIDDRQIITPNLYLQLLLTILIIVAAVVLAARRWSIYLRWCIIVCVLVAGWIGAIANYRLAGIMVPLLTPTLSSLLAAGLVTLYLSYQERQQKRFLRDAFSRYVSPNLVDDIISHPDKLELEGERRYLTFIFTDLAGFTSLAEQLDPVDIVGLLNGYIDGMCAIVFRHNGTIDKIVGDAIAAYWGAPLDQEDQRQRAVACALEMDAFAEEYRQCHQTVAGMLGITRIGINSGTAIIGNFGGDTFFDYTAHGDMVNTAARLEGANKYTGTRICIGEETRQGCPDTRFRPIGELNLKGKTEPLQVYEPVPEMPEEQFSEYAEAYKAVAALDPAVLGTFQILQGKYSDDPLIMLHYQRLKAGDTGAVITLAGK